MQRKNSTAIHQHSNNIKKQGPEIYLNKANGFTSITFGCVSEEANEREGNLNNILGDDFYPCDKDKTDKQFSSQFNDSYLSRRTKPGLFVSCLQSDHPNDDNRPTLSLSPSSQNTHKK